MSKIKAKYLNEIYRKKNTGPAKECIEYFLQHSQNLSLLVDQLRFKYPPDEMIFFPAEEIEIRFKASDVCKSFLLGQMTEEDFLKKLEILSA